MLQAFRIIYLIPIIKYMGTHFSIQASFSVFLLHLMQVTASIVYKFFITHLKMKLIAVLIVKTIACTAERNCCGTSSHVMKNAIGPSAPLEKSSINTWNQVEWNSTSS